MKKITQNCFRVASIIAAGLCSATAATYTVDNRPGRAADFDDLSEAIAGVVPGSILYVMGSQFSYGNVTLSKPLTIYGPGYLLGENEIAIAEANSAKIEELTIASSGDHSQLIGLQFDGVTEINGGTGLTFRRCYFRDTVWAGSSLVDGLSFEQCRMGVAVRFGFSGNDPGALNVVFSNSYIGDIRFSNDNSEVVVDQCVLRGGRLRNTTVQNSIFTGEGELTFDAETAFEHCLHPDTALPADDSNINNANLDMVFAGWNSGNPPGTGTTADTWTQLIDTVLNPALGAGTSGQDIGMYGGALPYVPSGVPPLPRITSIVAPALITSDEPITVEVGVASGQ